MMIWPLVHHFLVRTRGLNPWNLAGWAMYCMPGPALDIELHQLVKGERQPVGTVPERVELELGLFVEQRLILGDLVRPESLGLMLRDVLEGEDGVVVVVRTYGLDLDLDTFEEVRLDQYTY